MPFDVYRSYYSRQKAQKNKSSSKNVSHLPQCVAFPKPPVRRTRDETPLEQPLYAPLTLTLTPAPPSRSPSPRRRRGRHPCAHTPSPSRPFSCRRLCSRCPAPAPPLLHLLRRLRLLEVDVLGPRRQLGIVQGFHVKVRPCQSSLEALASLSLSEGDLSRKRGEFAI